MIMFTKGKTRSFNFFSYCTVYRWKNPRGVGSNSIWDRWGGVSYIFGSENFVKTYIFQDLVCCLFQFIFLGSCSPLAENLHFFINLAHNKEELNEKILNGWFLRPF